MDPPDSMELFADLSSQWRILDDPNLLGIIFSFLDGRNLAKIRTVCKKWNAIASSDHTMEAYVCS